jgi:hypothetical protein
MIRNVVVQLWSGSVIAARLEHDDPDPTQADLDAIATAWIAANDGVRPSVRVLEQSNVPSPASLHGPAGSPPHKVRAW